MTNAVLMLCLLCAMTAAQAAQPAPESIRPPDSQPTVDSATEAELAALDVELATLQQRWMQDVGKDLRHRGGATDLALASMGAALNAHVEEMWCAEAAACTEATDVDSAQTQRQALRDAALARVDDLSPTLHFSLVNHHLREVEPSQQDALVDRLIQRYPDQWGGWSLKLALLHARKAPEVEVTELLLRAAAAVRSAPDWYLPLVREVDAAYARVPMPAGMLDALKRSADLSEDGLGFPVNEPSSRLTLAFGFAMAVAMPSYGTFTTICNGDSREDPGRHNACVAITRMLAIEGQNVLDRSIGLASWHRLAEGTDAEATVIERKRQFHWQYEHGVALAIAGEAQASEFDEHAAAVRQPGSTEYTVMIDRMRRIGVDTTPPPQWLPSNPAVLQARR